MIKLTREEWEKFRVKPSLRYQIRQNALKMLADASALESPFTESPLQHPNGSLLHGQDASAEDIKITGLMVMEFTDSSELVQEFKDAEIGPVSEVFVVYSLCVHFYASFLLIRNKL